MVRLVRIHEHGGPEVLRVETVDIGAPGPGEVLIRQHAAGINFRDIYRRTGQHAVKQFPAPLGTEGAGVIEAVGRGVVGFEPGQRVVATGVPDGAFADARIVPQQLVVALPDTVSFETAAAMMTRGMTARVLLKRTYAVKAGDTILVHAAAGGVGLILCQWAKFLGANVIGTVGSDAKSAIALANGCDQVIVYSRENFLDRVLEITSGKGVQAVYDSVGKDTFEKSLRCLAPLGTMAQFGESSGDPDPIAPRRLGPLGSIYLTHPSLPNYHLKREDMEASASDLFDVVGSGAVRIHIGARYGLEDVAMAQIEMSARRTTGSIVLSLRPNTAAKHA
jgi:NADPH2:quinone reductase